MKLSPHAFAKVRISVASFFGKFFAAFVGLILSFAAAVAAPGSGGPDAFGYKWKDSDAAGGPSFSYVDISSSGTPVTGLADDNFLGPFPIGFTFNFYGAGYTEFYVASNGFIGFGPTTGYHKFTNVQLPVTTSPNNMVAWLWDDLIPRDDSAVYYQSFSGKLVIQFVRYGNNNSGYANERVDAEVILYASGRILIQYSSFTSNWPFSLCTVGLENADGTDGLSVAYNAPYLHNALAMQFTNDLFPPEPPVPASPADGAIEQPATVTLKWNVADGAASYRLQAATNNAFDPPSVIFDDSTLITTSQPVGPLASLKIYYWRVKAENTHGASAWSPQRKFTTNDLSRLGAPIQANTTSGFLKSNQSKVFYYDSQWWALACNQTDLRWYIWRYNGGVSWVKTISVMPGQAFQCDAVVDAGSGKLHVFGSHSQSAYFVRLSYVGGTWKTEAGYPVVLADFNNLDKNNPVSLVRAKNGQWWIFRIHNKILQAKYSTNNGQTWSATINVKAGLTTIYGTTDAAAFSSGGNSFVGVAYGERDTLDSKYGFLRHGDNDPPTAWTDESPALTFFGSERALNNICLAVDLSNNLYLMTNNNNASGSLPRNTLYKRVNNGAWKKFKINSGTLAIWKSPAIAIDKSNNRIYCMGINKTTNMAEYKTCLSGQEASLDTASVQKLLYVTGAGFDNISVPAANVTAVSGLMVCGDNTAAGDIWFRHLGIGNPPPVAIGTVSVDSDEVNANATYAISLTLAATGALSANSGTLHFRFPGNTYVPDAMPASQVLVDGVPTGKIVANNSTKQVSITTPVNLSGLQSFVVKFNSGAGLLSPTTASAYQLTAWTSAQPTPVSSPSYSLVAATTTVTPATVTLSTTDAGSSADYTLAFNLGDHGRLIAGTGTFTVKFGSNTVVANGPLSGVMVNTVNALASGDKNQRTVVITLPATVPLSNKAAVTLFLPKPAITNPTVSGSHTLTVATSVETTPVASNPYAIPVIRGRPIPGTAKNFDRANQSKMFYHDGKWWVTAQAKDDSKWYLWKFDGAAWTKTILIHNSSKVRPDCILEAAINKAFILLPGGSTTYILRLSYAFGNWAIDNGYPYAISDFAQNATMNLLRAANGNLWIFKIENSSLVAKRSSNGGQTWSANLILKNNLNDSKGLTDAVKFAYGGANQIGVGYAENSTAGSVYGFLRHKDNDPETVWIDETGAVPQFAGTTSDNHISMLAYNNEVLMIVKTNGGGLTTANVGLLRRDPAGAWFQYPIVFSKGWTRPTLAIDQTHNRLYVIGTRENGVKVGEMKNIALGDYQALLAAPIDTIFINNNDDFFDTSVAAHPVNGAMNLLVCNGNETLNELWYNVIVLNDAAKAASAEGETAAAEGESIDGVQVYPNPFNPNTLFRFTIPGPAGALAPVKLQLFNLSGQIVRTLVDEDLPKGIHQRRWNGNNDAGYRVASGVYLYRLQVGERVYHGRVQMIK
jgi:hypothetical protein